VSAFDSTFDRVAPAYDARRPSHPDAVFETIEQYAALPSDPQVLEIGIGTGQATIQMAALGWSVTGLEPGAQLVETARARLAGNGRFTVTIATFEDVDLADHQFDLVASGTAWHWVDPAVGYVKAHRVLRREGTLALWWNAHVPDTTDPRWTPIRLAYEREAPELARLAPLTPDDPDYDPANELRTCGLFDAVEEHVFPFRVRYTTNEFLALIGIYASHRHLDPTRRGRLHDALVEVVDGELGGTAVKPYEARLILGRRTANRTPKSAAFP
jgi:SAM-dependent methyltransferase